MNIDNITSENMTLNYDGKMKQIQVYEKEILKLQEQLEAYENMRKDLLDLILYQYPALSQSESDFKDDLLNILNKVGGSDE